MFLGVVFLVSVPPAKDFTFSGQYRVVFLGSMLFLVWRGVFCGLWHLRVAIPAYFRVWLHSGHMAFVIFGAMLARAEGYSFVR